MYKLIINQQEINFNTTQEVVDYLSINNQIFILIRGIPGSGKSTLAKEIVKKYPQVVHLETDMYFIIDGQYIFDWKKIDEAHKWCYDETVKNLLNKKSVLTSNTFLKKKGIDQYLSAATEFKVPFIIIECTGVFESTHAIPQKTMEKMKRQWKTYNEYR